MSSRFEHNIVLFESERVDKLYPFSVLHCAWELRTGPLMIYEKYLKLLENSSIGFLGRERHVASFIARTGLSSGINVSGNFLFIDGTLFPAPDVIAKIFQIISQNNIKNGILFENSAGERFGLYLNNKAGIEYYNSNNCLDLYDDKFNSLPVVNINDAKLIDYLWKALDFVDDSIDQDQKYLKKLNKFSDNKYTNVYGVNEEHIYIGDSVNIAPGVVIDASDGPVIIDDNSKIMPQSTILGPVYIGRNNTVKIGAKIYGHNVFGHWCKIGGEIENTIMQSYSNKQHEGFLGHSYLCEWVNFGADTNCSDLKNTYAEIAVNLNGETVNTSRMFLGVLCGDHTKTGINSMFTTGTIAGICGILVREWFLPNFISSYSWGGKKDSPQYKFNKAVETAKIVMARRGKKLLPEEEILLKQEYERVTKSNK